MTYKLCVHLFYDKENDAGDNDVFPCRLTNSRSEVGGKAMIAMLSAAYPDYTYELVMDGPSEELEDYDSDLYHALRYVLINGAIQKPTPTPKLLVIEGGRT